MHFTETGSLVKNLESSHCTRLCQADLDAFPQSMSEQEFTDRPFFQNISHGVGIVKRSAVIGFITLSLAKIKADNAYRRNNSSVINVW